MESEADRHRPHHRNNASYGAIGGVSVLMLWSYVSSLAILVVAELNAEIEHASPYGKNPGEKVAGEKKNIGPLAERTYNQQIAVGTFKPALEGPNCTVDRDLPPARHPPLPRPRLSDWVLSGLVVGETALLAYFRLRSKLKIIKA